MAYFGEIHPQILKKFDIKQRVVAFEVVLNNIPLPRESHDKARKKLELSAFQPVDKDLAFVVDKSVPAVQIIAAAKNADRAHITDVRVFDVYEGPNLPEGKKSYAVSFYLQDENKTLTDKQIDACMKKIHANLEQKLGAQLR